MKFFYLATNGLNSSTTTNTAMALNNTRNFICHLTNKSNVCDQTVIVFGNGHKNSRSNL